MSRIPPPAGRIPAIERVHTALTTIARRGSARVRREDAVSPVDQSLLRFIAEHPGTRAIDIAEHFGFNRSTVSRQIGALSTAGLIADAADDGGEVRRGQPLRLSWAQIIDGIDVLLQDAVLVAGEEQPMTSLVNTDELGDSPVTAGQLSPAAVSPAIA